MSMTKDTDMTPEMEAALDRLLAEARDLEPGPSDAFLNRVLADAATAAPPAMAPERQTRPRTGGLAALLGSIGGWQGVAAVAASALIGIGLGYGGTELGLPFLADMATVADPASETFEFETIDITALEL